MGDADWNAEQRSVLGDGRNGDVDRPGFILFSNVTGAGTVRRGEKKCSIKYTVNRGGTRRFSGMASSSGRVEGRKQTR